MPYQDRQTPDDELIADEFEDGAPSRGSSKFVLVVILIAVVAAGFATAFALLHSR